MSFTEAEKSSVEAFADGLIDLSVVWTSIADHARNDPSRWMEAVTLGRIAMGIRGDGIRAVLGLLDRNQFAPREAVVAEAVELADRAQAGAMRLAETIDGMVNSGGEAYGLQRASRNIRAMTRSFARFDSGLAYTEPRLDDNLAMRTPDGTQASRAMSPGIGPHGLYGRATRFSDEANSSLVNAGESFMDALEACSSASDVEELMNGGGWFIAIFSSDLQRLLTMATCLLADVRVGQRVKDDIASMIAFGTNTTRPDSFFVISYIFELLANRTDSGVENIAIDGHRPPRGAGYAMNRTIRACDSLQDRVPARVARHCSRVAKWTSQMWRDTDAWMVEGLIEQIAFHVTRPELKP